MSRSTSRMAYTPPKCLVIPRRLIMGACGPRSASGMFPPDVQGHRGGEQHRLAEQLVVSRHVQQVEPVAEGAHEYASQENAENVSRAACQAGAAQHDRRDGVEHI